MAAPVTDNPLDLQPANTARLTGYRRLTMRYERRADFCPALLTLAAAITCHKRRTNITT
jgi:hypothetical protein